MMIDLTIHPTKSTLNALGNPSKSFKSSSLAQQTHFRALSTLANDKKEMKILIERNYGRLFRGKRVLE